MTLKSAILYFICALGVTADDNSFNRIVFRSGGELNGKVISESKEDGRNFVVIRTETGSVLKLDKSRVISRIEKPNSFDSQYSVQSAKVDLSKPSGNWQMYRWCKENGGRAKFRDQMEQLLKEIVRLDPSDDDAWRRLGEVGVPHVKVDGKWIPEEQHYASRGYVRIKGRWMPKLLAGEKQKQDAAEAHRNSKKKALKNWRKNELKKGNLSTARAELKKILDPSVLNFFEETFLRKESNPKLREMYLDVIGNVTSKNAHRILVNYAVIDKNYEVRESAISQLEHEDGYPRQQTIQYARHFLSSSNNESINRAGELIGRINHSSGIVPLINKLITEHKESTGADPNRMNVGFGAGGTSFNTGGGPKFRVVRRQNESVRQALFDITGQDFGFDTALWRKWYISEQTVTDYNVRFNADE